MAEYLVCCGGLEPLSAAKPILRLNLHGPSPNIKFSSDEIGRKFLAHIPDVLLDLLDIAVYVYAADNALQRGSKIDTQFGARWRRRFRFLIPVRIPELWWSEAVQEALVETLNFLADESYRFEFRPIAELPPMSRYFQFGDDDGSRFSPEEVALFSGGIDSFAGAVDLLVGQGRRVALVSHLSVNTTGNVQRMLVEELQRRLKARLLHVQIRVHLIEGLSAEHTQRTRSFLFAALGFVTARLFGADRINFFENGIVSLNLPPLGQVVGARATRTTHPKALRGFEKLFSSLLGQPFSVANPYMWLTKAEVIKRAIANGVQDQLRYTRSCSRVMAATKLHPHCGLCSQCIDRRFGMLVADAAADDPVEAYAVELFTGPRPNGTDRAMALSYVQMASSITAMTDSAFLATYGEVGRALSFLNEHPNTASRKIFGLYQRHATGICEVIENEIRARASQIREGALPPDSLLAMITAQSAAFPTYPAPTFAAAPSSSEPTLRIALDEKARNVIFEGCGEVKGVAAALILALAKSFRSARDQELAPENYPFVPSSELRDQLGLEDDETLRKRIQRCRLAISKVLSEGKRNDLDAHTVLESLTGHGYRLNPDRVLLIAPTEIRH